MAIASGPAARIRGDGPPVDRLRALGPPHWLIGRSVHSQREAEAGHLADYLVFGTVFPSASKPDEQTQGIERLKALTGAAIVPILAIGGIDPARAAACRAAGAAGVAAIGIFLPAGRAPGAMGISGRSKPCEHPWQMNNSYLAFCPGD
jgi:thiamine-phosphate diphosphorylase